MSATSPTTAEDIGAFFQHRDHWIYKSKGTPSDVSPDSVYHLGQLEVLFEDRHFHFLTTPAVHDLIDAKVLRSERTAYDANEALMVWRRGLRYTRRLIRAHVDLVKEYSNEAMNKATGSYAETLSLMGLSRLGLELVARNGREYRGKVWTETDHDLDFVMEKDGTGYGVEVKNTWVYFPSEELKIKLNMCHHLGLRPLFIARNRHAGQWDAVRDAGGLLYIFKTKVFPPGHEDLTRRIWRQMRLPVAVWHDWPGQFYPAIRAFLG